MVPLSGEAEEANDIDILVEYSEVLDIFMVIDLEDHLRKILNRKVDIVRKEAPRPELKDII